MPSPRLRFVLALLLLGLLVAWLWPRPSEEDRVRAVVQAVAAGAEAGDVGDILEHVDPAYHGSEDGFGLDLKTLRAALALQFMRRGPIGVILSPIEVQVDGDHAHARFDAAVTEGGGSWRELLPSNGDGWHLEVDFVRDPEDDAWRVITHQRTSWTRDGPPLAPATPR